MIEKLSTKEVEKIQQYLKDGHIVLNSSSKVEQNSNGMDEAEAYENYKKTGSVTVDEQLRRSELVQIKLTAFREARSLHPNTRSNANQGTLGYQPVEQAPSTKTVLETAKTIYDWLIE